MDLINQYKINIYEKWSKLKQTYEETKDNKLIAKLFEWYSCIKLSEEYKRTFYEYNDIDPDFREENKMSKTDTGIDCCDMLNTIVQCKLRSKYLNWGECGTFFGSQVICDDTKKEKIIRWKDLIITRNADSKLSHNLSSKSDLFVDKPYILNDFINYCNNLITNPPEYPKINITALKLRDYQIECIKKINDMKNNLIINLPTGCGKNFIIINCLEPEKKYLIMVPRIILMEQILSEIKKLKPQLDKQIQMIGNGRNNYNDKKLITICVYNSVSKIKNFDKFNKIFIDEAHHIITPEIYNKNDDEQDNDEQDNDEQDNDEQDNDEEDNDDNEVNDDDNYIKTIKYLTKYKNNVYMSATIDQQNDFEYYKKDIRDMIIQGYLSDYTINVPIFEEDPSNKNICWHLVKNYSHIIIYCSNKKEGSEINKLLNKLVKGCSDYIDCDTSKSKRDIAINKFKSGKLTFLVNVKILVEGFDAPITKGVCFLHMPSSKTALIQIIGRALRLHPEKKLANIILSCSTLADESSINKFLKIMSLNDSRIKKSYQNKNLSGYITLEKVIDDSKKENIDKEENILETRFEMIYNSFGILLNKDNLWKNNLEEVKKYIDNNDKKPSEKDQNKKINKIGLWINRQNSLYKKNIININYIPLFKNFLISYEKYFLDNKTTWNNNFESVKDFIDKNNKRPVNTLGTWITTQIQNYKNKEYIMKDDMEIYNKWGQFINNDKYKKYFWDNKTEWIEIFNKVKKYIDDNNNKPLSRDKNKFLGRWIITQQTNHNKKRCIMKEKDIWLIWNKFINDDKYKIYFSDNKSEWIITFDKVKKYIDDNNNRPLSRDKNKENKFLGRWIITQQTNYNKKRRIMKEKDIWLIWNKFINDDKYKIYFSDNKDEWLIIFDKVKKYIDDNEKKPSFVDKNEDIKKLSSWINTQSRTYKKKIK